jgi:hypothetical protein
MVVEDSLHPIAEASRNAGTIVRVHRLADSISAEARRVATRADKLSDERAPSPQRHQPS